MINENENVAPYLMFGFLGVEFFFVLSGYLMTAKAGQDEGKEIGPATSCFIFNKICSFYPYYIVAWVMAMFVDGIGKTTGSIFYGILKSAPTLLQVDMAGFKGYQVPSPTWYLSAMILSMLVLYPLLLHFRKTFIYVLAPIICIFSYGIIFLKIGNLAYIEPFDGWIIYAGVLRGLGGISLGCICHECSNAISCRAINRHGEIVISFIEIIAFGLAIFLEQTRSGFRPDFLFVCMIGIGIIAGFCDRNALNIRIDSNYSFVGRFSLCIYLADSVARALVLKLMPNATRDERLVNATLLLILHSFIILIVGSLIKKLGKNIGELIKLKLLEH